MRVIGPENRFTSCIDLLFQFLDVECGHFTRFKDIELLLEIGVVSSAPSNGWVRKSYLSLVR